MTYILHLQHISVQIGHIPSAQCHLWLVVTVLDSADLTYPYWDIDPTVSELEEKSRI